MCPEQMVELSELAALQCSPDNLTLANSHAPLNPLPGKCHFEPVSFTSNSH